MNEIDAIASAMNGDRRAVLRHQAARVQREIVERLAINIRTRETIHELVSEVRRATLQLEPAHEGLPDDPRARQERMLLEHEYRALILRLSDEQRSCWLDVQRLKAELRGLERDLLAQHKRERRLLDT